jgi:hypothetical protein
VRLGGGGGGGSGKANRVEKMCVPFNMMYTLEHSELWEGQKDVQ